MYFSPQLIKRSVDALRKVHPFFGITFLACKRRAIPIGNVIACSIDEFTREHMNSHHKLAPESSNYFQPFKSYSVQNFWLSTRYPSSGLQAINTQTFASAFLHSPGSGKWGWREDYVRALRQKLAANQKIPAWALAIWLYRSKRWATGNNLDTAIDCFIKDYKISEPELEELFLTASPDDNDLQTIFVKRQPNWIDLKQYFDPPPDAKPERGGTLTYLHIHGSGPTGDMVFRPARRMTIITGDNGLGKTLVMECAWWALTGTWAGRPALPLPDARDVYIEFAVQGTSDARPTHAKVSYDLQKHAWPQISKDRDTIPGLTVYARVDGSFAVWDPIKFSSGDSGAYILSNAEVWDGQEGRSDGLIRDWVKWQNTPERYPFGILTDVLESLSPSDLGRLTADEPVRIPRDHREIPTIKHSYGATPILYASAGVKRIVALTYLIVWAWNEHLIASKLAKRRPETRLVVLIDEIEAHLHPKWQRQLLPPLSTIGAHLEASVSLQLIVATHSPLVVASGETVFDPEGDALVHLDISESGKISIDRIPFIKYGEVSSWLTSPLFQLKHARNREAELAIEKAKSLQENDSLAVPSRVREVSEDLIRCLPSDDRFWPRWIGFAEKFGVKL